MSEPSPPPVIGYSRSEPCPRCGQPMVDGWCDHCAGKRQVLWGLLLIFVGPVLGFGTCVAGLAEGSQYGGIISMVGIAAFFLSPVVGIIYLIAMSIIRRKRRQ